VYQTALRSYETVHKSTMSGREVEAAALTKSAIRLRECQSSWNSPGHAAKLDAALKFNQRIWSILQAELGKSENPLPDDLKADLLRLSAFVDKRIFEIMAYPGPEKLSILISINENLAAGLRTRPETANPLRYDQLPAASAAGI
jgi:flagellar biosynthesis activator protein FlaF